MLLLLILFPVTLMAQISDGFTDGDFDHNPLWRGDSLKFQVTADHKLQLQATGSDTTALFTPSVWLAETEWRFWIRLAFNTSSNNYARVYLASRGEEYNINPDGYYLQIGGGSDSIDLLKKDGLKLTHLYRFHSFSTSHSNNMIRFRIIRFSEGIWQTFIDTTGGENFMSDGNFSDTGTIEKCSLGAWCRFTASNSSRFYFDDFYAGPLIIDTKCPAICSTQVLDRNSILLTFSEAVETVSATDRNNYRLKVTGRLPDSVNRDGGGAEKIKLHYQTGLEEGVFDSLMIKGIKDNAGNLIRDTLLPACYYRAKAYDIVIDEILADPEPSAGLPSGEFLEMYNRTPFPISLGGWKLYYGSSVRQFPEISIPPHGYLIAAKDSSYFSYGSCVLLFTAAASLSNEGTTVSLKDADQHIIHSVSYLPEWFDGTFKEEGGWSLEMIDVENPCGCHENWAGSADPAGGTPGRVNSVSGSNPDITSPSLVRAIMRDSVTLQVYFSEAMDSLVLADTIAWRFGPDGRHPTMISPLSPDYRSAIFKLPEVIGKGEILLLTAGSMLHDCAGNLNDTSGIVRFGMADSLVENDVVINELLPEPKSGGSRFVELYNRSTKVLDLSVLLLSAKDTVMGLLPEAKPMIPEGYLFFPGEYIVFTNDPADISARYQTPSPDRILRMTGFPVFNNDSGKVVLARRDNFGLIDRVVYTREMQYPLLATKEGVSLERLDPDRPSGDAGNWHSAASTVGFATPGFQNSQKLSMMEDESVVSLFPEVISPDNDGIDDILSIILRPDRPGFSAVIDIYDAMGRRVRNIAANALLPTEGVFYWDGATGQRTIVPMGIYILYVELVHPDGAVKRVKKAITVCGKL